MSEALIAALVEIEQYVGRLGWDQPARLFALVPTAELIAAEPSLRPELNDPLPDALSSIEQVGFHPGADLAEALAAIGWPPAVAGCALALERSFLPPEIEDDLPSDPEQAALFVARHPRHLDLRVVVGVLREGGRHGVARVRGEEGSLLGGGNLVPALADALSHTLE